MTDVPALPDRFARLLPPGTTRHVEHLGDVDMHLLRRGSGRPILLVHGNPTWSFLWRKVMAELGDASGEVIAPDLIGLGLSSRVAADAHTLDAHIRWLGALIDRLDLRDVVLCVQDWGGPIGVGAFLDRPERLGALVVLNTVIGPPRDGFKPTRFHRFAQSWLSWPAFRLLGFPQRGGLHSVQGDRDSIRGLVAQAYHWPLRTPWRNQAPLALARMVPNGFDHPSVPTLRRIAAFVEAWQGPTEIVWGDRDPILGRVRGHVERTLPHARVTRTDAGHFLQEEVPGAIADAIRRVADVR